MNSSNLKELGFTEPLLLHKLTMEDLPYQSGLFALIDKSEGATTDIVYIGRAKNLIKRIFGDIIGGQGKKSVRKIHERLFTEGCLQKLEISWLPSDNVRARKTDLVQRFKQEHAEMPAWNKKA